MNITNLDLIRSAKPLKLLSEKGDIPFSAAFAIAKNIAVIDAAIADYMTKKSELDKAYLTDGAEPTIKAGMEEDYLRELTELNSTNIDIVIQKIAPKSMANTPFPPKLLLPILFMFE